MPDCPPEMETGDISEPEPPDLRITTTDRLPWPSPSEREAWLALPPEPGVHSRLLQEIPALCALEARLPRQPAPSPANAARILFWNVERLRHRKGIAARIADLAPAASLLAEVDVGMARSGNLHTLAALAEETGQGWAFGVEFVELGLGDAEERARHAGETNLAGLHGNAILSPHVLTRLAMLRLDADGGWFDGSRGERRIGGRMALFAQLEIGGRPVTLVCTHFESHTDPADRCRQMARLLDGIDAYDAHAPVLIGGDCNTSTFARSHRLDPATLEAALAEDPERLRDPVAHEPLFALAADRGYRWRDCNLEGSPTQRRHAADGRPAGRLDWFFCRGLRCRQPTAVPAVDAAGRILSDHDGILVTVVPE